MFDAGKCLNCDVECDSLFCVDCDPDNDILPEDMFADTIARMNEGKVGYTVPWAMFARADLSLWIVGSYSTFDEPKGTVHMKIKRKGDYILVERRSTGDHKYSPRELNWDEVISGDYLPVKLVRRI